MNGIINKKTVGGFFLAVLILLIFFSKTIYNYNLPVVTAVKPEKGRLSKLETSTGIVDFAEIENLYAAVAGTVEEVLVKEGDHVTKGQEILRLGFDREEAQRKLSEIQNSRSKMHNDLQNLNIRMEKLERSIDELQSEVYTEDTVSSYDLDLLEIDIKKSWLEYKELRERHEDGEVSDLELDRARYSLDALYIKQNELKRKMNEQKESNKESVEDKEKSRETKLKDYEADKASLNLDIQSKNIDITALLLQEEPYKQALEDFETYAVIKAPVEGTVISLGVGKGEDIRESQLISSIGSGTEFNVDCNITLENNFVIQGDTCELSNSSHAFKGVVTKVKPTAQGKTVSVSFSSDEVTMGETFDITFKKESTTTYTLVPNSALKQDSEGYYINQIKRRDGIIGKEFYLERVGVYIGDSDDSNTAIIQGITFFEPIMLLSDKPVDSGETISLKNVGDFFEN